MPCGTCFSNAMNGLRRVARGAAGQAKSKLQSLGLSIDAASPETAAHRRDQCGRCPFAFRSNDPKHADSNGLANWTRCLKCGCPIVDKTKIASESCPHDPPRWSAVQAA